MKLFITGGTGFLGKNLIRELADTFQTIYILTRNTDIGFFKDLANVVLVGGDITHPELFQSNEEKNLVRQEITHFIHAAAFYDLQASHEDCYLQNVLGTQNILHFAKSIKNLKYFYYVSTIAVADDQQFYFDENSLPKRSQFNDHYSKTKYFAEKFIRDNIDKFSAKVIIIRPGIIVGNSITGEREKIDGPYYFTEAFKKHWLTLKGIKILPLSYNPRTKLPIIPVDHCSNYIKLIIERSDQFTQLQTFHLISSEIPSIHDFLLDISSLYNLKIKFIPVPKNFLHSTLLNLLGIPKEVIPFMFSKVSYDKTATNIIVPEILESRYSLYKSALLQK
jgi:nucleoside-diphosphate-sugar epimerase